MAPASLATFPRAVPEESWLEPLRQISLVPVSYFTHRLMFDDDVLFPHVPPFFFFKQQVQLLTDQTLCCLSIKIKVERHIAKTIENG